MKKVYIDTDVLIASKSRSETNHLKSKKFTDYVIGDKSSGYQFFASGYTLLEMVTNVRRKTGSKDKARSLAWQLTRSWKYRIRMLGFKPKSIEDLFHELTETAIELGIPTGDTIHSQLIIDSKMDYLVTWNKKHFKPLRRKLRKLEIMNPEEFLDLTNSNV